MKNVTGFTMTPDKAVYAGSALASASGAGTTVITVLGIPISDWGVITGMVFGFVGVTIAILNYRSAERLRRAQMEQLAE